MLAKMRISKGLVNRKAWAFSLSPLQLVLHNKTSELNEICYPFNWVHCMLIGGKFSSFLRNSLWTEAAKTATLLENDLFTPTRDLRPFQQFFGKGKKSILTWVPQYNEMCKSTHHDNSHWTKLANQGTLVIGLVSQKVIQLIPYECSTPKQKSQSNKKCDFSA